MKTLVIISYIIVVATAATLPQSEQQFVDTVHANCQSNPSTYADEELLKRLGDNQNDAQVGIHMLCMSKGAGLQKQNGEIDKGKVKDKVSLVITDSSQAIGVINKCAVSKETPEKTAVLLWVCLNQNQVPYRPNLK